MRNECTGYYEKIEHFYGLMKDNFDKKPIGIPLMHVICGILYSFVHAIRGDFILDVTLRYPITVLWIFSLFTSLLYFIFALLKDTKNRKKLFALSVPPTFFLFFILFNMVILLWAIDEFYSFIEWIPLIIFWLLPCGWCVFMIKRIRKEIRGEEVKPLKIPLWLIVVAIGSFAPLASFSGRRNIGNWLPENLFLYYMAYLIILLNLVVAKFLLDMLMYCKITLFGKNKR